MKRPGTDTVFVISYGATNGQRGNEHEDDYVVKSMGAFGLWQAMVCVIAASNRFIAMWNMLSIVFLTPNANYACVEFETNTTNDIINSTCYKDCIEYKYRQDIFEHTLISEFGLICEYSWLASFTQTILMFGLLLGVSLFGWISDRFGRRNALMTSAFINVTFMMAAPFSPNYWSFNVMRFFIGFASGGSLIASVVFVLEVVGPQHREVAGCCAILPDGIAQATLALFAYLSPTWRIYLLAYSVASVFIMIFMIFLPETPRWLVSNGKIDKALEIMTKAAKCNKLKSSNIKDNIVQTVAQMNLDNNKVVSTTYLDLFKSKQMSLKTICSVGIWTITGICYFGINQYVTFLGSNLFIVVIVTGIIQVPITPIGMVLNKRYGRKPTTIISLLASGLTMIGLTFSPEGSIRTVLGIVGFSATSITFSVIYVYASELFPTPLRNMGYGLSSGGAKIGAMTAPFLANMRPQWIPSLVFAILPFIGIAFCLLLPETKGQSLKDTVD